MKNKTIQQTVKALTYFGLTLLGLAAARPAISIEAHVINKETIKKIVLSHTPTYRGKPISEARCSQNPEGADRWQVQKTVRSQAKNKTLDTTDFITFMANKETKRVVGVRNLNCEGFGEIGKIVYAPQKLISELTLTHDSLVTRDFGKFRDPSSVMLIEVGDYWCEISDYVEISQDGKEESYTVYGCVNSNTGDSHWVAVPNETERDSTMIVEHDGAIIMPEDHITADNHQDSRQGGTPRDTGAKGAGGAPDTSDRSNHGNSDSGDANSDPGNTEGSDQNNGSNDSGGNDNSGDSGNGGCEDGCPDPDSGDSEGYPLPPWLSVLLGIFQNPGDARGVKPNSPGDPIEKVGYVGRGEARSMPKPVGPGDPVQFILRGIFGGSTKAYKQPGNPGDPVQK